VPGLSSLILGSEGEATLRVIRPGWDRTLTGLPVTEYHIQGDTLPADDGWRLEDPGDAYLLDRIRADAMTLSGYLFDEIYQGISETADICPLEGWTSVIITGDRIRTLHGKNPDSQASAVYPGDDLFLAGLLSSTLLSWYILVTSQAGTEPGVILHRIRDLPIAPVDPYEADEKASHDRIGQLVLRIRYLARQKEVVHTWHDHQRLENQISIASGELDSLVFRLYRLSPEEADRIRRRVHNRYGSRHPVPGIDIF
jgi:hypothetical protein